MLAAEDGRYYAIDILHIDDRPHTQAIATEEEIGGRVYGFGLPSGPGLFLHLARVAHEQLLTVDPMKLFDEHPQGRWPDDAGPLFDTFETACCQVVFAALALEAFANEVIPEGYEHEHANKGSTDIRLLDKEGIQRQLNTSEKLGVVLPDALKVPSPKGRQPWQRFVEIRRLRDRIVHLKVADCSWTGPEVKTLWGDLLRTLHVPYCDHAHDLMGCFGGAVKTRRWFRCYPYL